MQPRRLLDACSCVRHYCLQVAFSVIDRRPSLFLSRFCQDRGIHLLP